LQVWGGGRKGSGTVPRVNDLCAEEGEGEQGGFAGDVKGRGVGEGSSDPEGEIGVREGSRDNDASLCEDLGVV